MLKYLFYIMHIFFILYSTVGIIYYWQSLIILLFTNVSWYFNDNKCLLTQLEYYLFNESLIDYYYKYILKNKRDNSKFRVPQYQRIIVKIILFLGSIYYLI